jgi:hypothetical protein
MFSPNISLVLAVHSDGVSGDTKCESYTLYTCVNRRRMCVDYRPFSIKGMCQVVRQILMYTIKPISGM